MSNFSWDEISCCCPTSFASSKYLNVVYLMNVDINIIDILILHWGVIFPIFFIGWFCTQMFWFEAGCRPLPAMNPHATAFVPGAGYASTLGIRENDNRGSPLLTVIDPKKSLHFTFNPFFFESFSKVSMGNYMNTQSSRFVCVDFFFGVFRWGRGQFQSQLRQGLFVFMATSLTTCALWNLLWIGPGLPTAPSGLNGRGLMSLRLRGLANGIISHFDLTFVLVETSRDVRKLHVNLSVGASRGASQSLETFGVWTSRCNWLWG